MMKVFKSPFMMLLLMSNFLLISCVPKATENKAICGKNESFNNITRSCFSIVEPRYKPVGTKNSEVMFQEISKKITLSYTDGNANQASLCKVSGISSNVVAISPQVIEGGVFDKAEIIFELSGQAYNLLPAGLDKTTAQVQLASMQTSLVQAKITYNYTILITLLDTFKTSLDSFLTIVAIYAPSTPSISSKYTAALTASTEFTKSKIFVENRCDCSGGICTTYIAPKRFESGTGGFSYTVTDIDGESQTQAVSLAISAMSSSTITASSFLRPVSKSIGFITGNESINSTSLAYPFTLSGGADYFGSTSFNFSYNTSLVTKIPASFYFPTFGKIKTYVASDKGLGKITDCLGLGDSTGSNDLSCNYVPDDGNANDNLTPAIASKTIGGLTYTALAEGEAGKSISIVYKDISSDLLSFDSLSNNSQKFAYTGTLDEVYVRVSGNTITVIFHDGVTTTAQIENVVKNDLLAKSLVQVSGGSSTLASVAPAALPVALEGGAGAYDSFSYSISNNYGASTNSSAVVFKINAVTDKPYWKPYPSLSSPLVALADQSGVTKLEGSSTITFTIPASTTYSDVDSIADTCSVSTDPNELILGSGSVYGLSGVNLTEVSKAFNDFPVAPSLIAPSCAISGLGNARLITFTIDRSALIAQNTFGNYALLFKVYNAATPTLVTSNPTYQAVKFSITGINDRPDMTGISWTASSNTPATSLTSNTWSITSRENSTASPSKAIADITIVPDETNTGFETDQTLTLTATSSNQSLLPDANLTWTTVSAAGATPIVKRLTFSTVKNKSGTVNINLTLKDSGGISNGGVDTYNKTIAVTVSMVNDPPFFITAPTKVETNEGGLIQTDGFKVDEDEGATADEDAQPMAISAITSDNPAVLPISGITLFYDLNDNGVEDTGESRTVGQMLETSAALDSSLHKFYLKLRPIAGIAGNSNITVTASDGTNTTSTSFSLIVHSIASLHGGWANISALGIKTDKNGAPASSFDLICNYNKTNDVHKCKNTDLTQMDCKGTQSPHSLITPEAANVLFWDSTSRKCYRSQGTDKYSWIEMNTTCPITRVTGGENYIYDSTLTPAQSVPSPTAANQYYYNPIAKTCLYTKESSPSVWAWDVVNYQPSKVTLSWNAFTMVGSGADSNVQIIGWNVYRREAGADYDFKTGALKSVSTDVYSVSNPAIRTFTDKTALAGKVYYYVVRPIDSINNTSTNFKFSTYTPEIFSEVRVLAPVENYSFVHRWMVNQEVCNGMHMTTTTTNKVDPTHNYRCPYSGPGESSVSAGFYDIGKDMLVDIAESGCPYTKANHCTSDGCIGIGAPSGSLTNIAANDIYYDRSAGKCHIYDGAAWAEFNTAGLNPTVVAKTNSALNAPLVNVTSAKAAAICSARTTTNATSNLTGTTPPVANPSLPSKADFIAFAASPIGRSDPEITDIEQGYSLNIQSRCNSSNANGLEVAFTDSSIPSTSFNFSVAGTSSSGIRSLYTGSIPWGLNYATETCSSRYGVQDVYGNVAEWVKDQMNCTPINFTCVSKAGTELHYDFGGGIYYGFDLYTGPYNDASADSTAGPGDGYLTQWDFRDELFGAGKFSFPVGMPIYSDIATTVVSSPALSYILDIGPTSGITTNQLHEDGITLNTANINGDGAFAVGGSYLSGSRSGRFSSELLPTSTNNRVDIGFRCIVPILKDNYPADSRHLYSY